MFCFTPWDIENVLVNVAFETDKMPKFGDLNVQRCKKINKEPI